METIPKEYQKVIKELVSDLRCPESIGPVYYLHKFLAERIREKCVEELRNGSGEAWCNNEYSVKPWLVEAVTDDVLDQVVNELKSLSENIEEPSPEDVYIEEEDVVYDPVVECPLCHRLFCSSDLGEAHTEWYAGTCSSCGGFVQYRVNPASGDFEVTKL